MRGRKKAEQWSQVVPYPGQHIQVVFKINNKLPKQVFCQMCVENNYEIDLGFYGSHQTCGLSLTRRHVETIFSGPCCGGLLSFWKTSYQESISWNRKEDSTDAFLLCGDHFLENVEWLKLYSINAVIKNILKVFFFKYGKLFNCLLSTKKYQNTDCVCVCWTRF